LFKFRMKLHQDKTHPVCLKQVHVKQIQEHNFNLK